VVRQPRVGPLHGPAQPEEQRPLPDDLGLATAALSGDDGVVDVAGGEVVADGVGVVAAVQMQRFDVEVQSADGDRIQGRGEQADVVAVGAVDGPSDGDAGGLGSDRPLPPELGPVGGVLAGAFTSAG